MKRCSLVAGALILLTIPAMAELILHQGGDVYDGGTQTGTYTMDGSNIFDFSDLNDPPDISTWVYNIYTNYYDLYSQPEQNDYRFCYSSDHETWTKQKYMLVSPFPPVYGWITIEDGTFENNY